VFVVKRNSRLGFHGGAHVFPGGSVDEQDRSSELCERLSAFDSGRAAGTLNLEDADHARGFFVAAARELFEEAGILLATPGDESGRESLAGETFDAERKSVADGDVSFADFLAGQNCALDLSGLVYFRHFITPVREKKRFDTRFFLARVADDEVAEHDRGETVDGEWIVPAAALAKYRAKEIELLPPTIHALEWLDEFDSIDAALDAAASAEVRAIQPQIVVQDGSVVLLYPDDPDYGLETIDLETSGRDVARLLMVDGLWCRA
jgi:8-oxo-dGTP pyrophosphatase MutT (NUDIX family)